jgi:hypothetical protein
MIYPKIYIEPNLEDRMVKVEFEAAEMLKVASPKSPFVPNIDEL